MKSRYLWTVITLVSLMFFSMMSLNLPAYSATQYGPRSDYNLFFYADENIMYTAMKAGTIDLMMWPLTPAQLADANTDPDLQLMPVTDFAMRAWSLNNNYTTTMIPNWGLIRNPLNQEEFRQAIFHCTDRAYYTQIVCGGHAVPLHVPVSVNSDDWWNQTAVTYSETWLDFDVDKAKNALAAGGWIDTDDNGILNFPAGWDGASGQDMLPIRVCRRNDDSQRRDAMNHLISKLTECKIALEVYDFNQASEATVVVIVGRSYHIYASSWSLRRYPTYLYNLFHSSRWYPGGTNYHTGVDKYGSPNYPGLDTVLDSLLNPPNLIAAKADCQRAQGLIIEEYKIMIPLWNPNSFYAYKNLMATVNEEGYGPNPENIYLPLNAYRAVNPTAPIRVGTKNPPVSLNVITGVWVWEDAVFRRYMDNFLDFAPYNVMVDKPWCAYDWDQDTWVDPDTGTNKSRVTYWLRKGQKWIKPVEGNVLRERNATDHPWSCWYWDSCPAGYYYTGYRDIKYLVMPNDYEIEVYFDTNSFWSYLNPWGRDLYPPTWKQEPISHLRTDTWVEGTNMTTGPGIQCLLNAVGNRSEGTPIEIVSINVDGTPLVRDTTPYLSTHTGDYVIAGTTAGGPKIRIFTDYAPGQVLTVTYWARGDYSGNTPGGLPWQDVLIGSGMHYISELNNVMGGWCTFKANRNYWLETPPLGEVDFAWYYIDGPKPRSGYCMIDILDVVKCTAAYDSTGNGAPGGRPPSSNWEPGADLAMEIGVIDIFDVVTITGKYETVFGIPPP